MRNKALLFSSILFVSGSVLAGQGLLENVAEQAVKETAPAVAPTVVDKVDAANQSLEKAKNFKDSVENAPEALKGQAKESVKASATQKVNEALPEDAKTAVETVKTTKGSASNLKQKVKSVPNSTKAIKGKVKEKAPEEALDFLR